MDTIISWLESFLKPGLPAATFSAVIALGALVSTIVAFIRRQWAACTGPIAIVTVFVVSAITNLVVFAGAGLLDRAHILYLCAAVIMVGLSAIGTNQVLKNTVLR